MQTLAVGTRVRVLPGPHAEDLGPEFLTGTIVELKYGGYMVEHDLAFNVGGPELDSPLAKALGEATPGLFEPRRVWGWAPDELVELTDEP